MGARGRGPAAPTPEGKVTGESTVPRPSRRVKIVLSVLVALGAWLLAYAPAQASAAAFVPPSLLEHAAANPSESYDVIVVGTPKGKLAKSLRNEVGSGLGRIAREYSILRGVATELKGGRASCRERVSLSSTDRRIKRQDKR